MLHLNIICAAESVHVLFKETWALRPSSNAAGWDFGHQWRTKGYILGERQRKYRTKFDPITRDGRRPSGIRQIHQYTKKLLDVAHPDETFLKTIFGTLFFHLRDPHS